MEPIISCTSSVLTVSRISPWLKVILPVWEISDEGFMVIQYSVMVTNRQTEILIPIYLQSLQGRCSWHLKCLLETFQLTFNLIYISGVSDKWPKSKFQNFKSTQWFSYEIWIKNSKEPIVYLHNGPLPEQHHFLIIQWEIHFLTFLNTDQNAPKKILE